jgi:hypothetical protein
MEGWDVPLELRVVAQARRRRLPVFDTRLSAETFAKTLQG